LETLPSGNLLRDIRQLLAEKSAGAELDHGPRIGSISDFIEGELARSGWRIQAELLTRRRSALGGDD